MTFIVAIDGPAGSGKSSIGQAVALRLGLTRVDTGALYRAITWAARERGIRDEAETAALCDEIVLRFDGDRLWAGEREITREIRDATITADVSRVAALPKVRARLLDVQRRLAHRQPRGAVLEGRDIGTVVFPDAEVKIFLTASAEERARRRKLELDARGDETTYAEVLSAIRQRDAADERRAVAPLRKAEGAFEVDSTGKSPEEVTDAIVAYVGERLGARPDLDVR